MKSKTAFVLAAVAFASPAFAKVAVAERVAAAPYNGAAAQAGCMIENANVSVNFNGMETDVASIKTKFDAKMAEIEKLVKAAGLTKSEMQSMNYSINPQNYGSGMSSTYQFSGSVSYTVLPSGKATELMAELTKKGYQASVNVSSYRNGGVPCTQQQ